MDKPISNNVVVGLLIVAVLVAFSPVFTGRDNSSANQQEATAVASAQGCLDTEAYEECFLAGGGDRQCKEDNCGTTANQKESNEYADSYDDDCRGWRGWVWPSCWWSN